MTRAEPSPGAWNIATTWAADMHSLQLKKLGVMHLRKRKGRWAGILKVVTGPWVRDERTPHHFLLLSGPLATEWSWGPTPPMPEPDREQRFDRIEDAIAALDALQPA